MSSPSNPETQSTSSLESPDKSQRSSPQPETGQELDQSPDVPKRKPTQVFRRKQKRMRRRRSDFMLQLLAKSRTLLLEDFF
jgi:hypothetical protein